MTDPSGRSLHSCIYEGWVRHRRYVPVRHSLQYRLFMMYLDLSELPDLFDPYRLWSARHRAPARFDRRDYHGDPAVPLDEAVRETVRSVTGQRPDGPIRILTHLRYWGTCFNPVSFYYIFDGAGDAPDTIMAEITNTPWKERRALVLSKDLDWGKGPISRFRFAKDFHVSPFWPLEHRYDWRFQAPSGTLIVHFKNRRDNQVVFDATLSMKRLEINSVHLRRVLTRYPFMTLKVLAGIHWQALKLYVKRAGFHAHPDTRGNPGGRHRPGSDPPMDPDVPPGGRHRAMDAPDIGRQRDPDVPASGMQKETDDGNQRKDSAKTADSTA